MTALVQGMKHIKFVNSPISSVSTPTPPVLLPPAAPTPPAPLAPPVLTPTAPTPAASTLVVLPDNLIAPPGAVSITKLRDMVSMFGIGVPRKFIYLFAVVVIVVIGYLAWKWFNRPKQQLDLSSVDEDIDLIRNIQDDEVPVYSSPKEDQSK